MHDINLLLLGETGAGKTAFLNALVNYTYHKNIKNAQEDGVIITAPMTVSVLNSANKEQWVNLNVKDNQNSCEETKINKAYISLQGCQLRVIDGISVDNILSYFPDLQQIHGVCFFVKSSLSRANALLEYDIKRTLVKFDIPIVKNICFVITYGRTVNFNPAVAKSVLQGIAKSIKSKPPYIEIPLNPENTFCVENDAFINMAAETQGVKIQSTKKREVEESWDLSQKECFRLVNYLYNIEPYKFPQFETQNAITTFFENNTEAVCALAESSFRCMKQCEKMVSDANTALELLQTIRREIQDMPLPQKSYAAAVGPSSSSVNKNPVLETLKKFWVHLMHMFQIKGGKRKGPNFPSVEPKKSSFENQNKSRVKSNEGKQNDETAATAMTLGDRNSLMEKLNQIMPILNTHEKFMQNMSDNVKIQYTKVFSFIRKLAQLSVFLERNGKEDTFQKKIKDFLTTLSGCPEQDGERIWECLSKQYQECKTEVQEQETLEISPDDVEKITKRLEKLQHYQEVYNELLDIK